MNAVPKNHFIIAIDHRISTMQAGAGHFPLTKAPFTLIPASPYYPGTPYFIYPHHAACLEAVEHTASSLWLSTFRHYPEFDA
jgi:hypothetical protein